MKTIELIQRIFSQPTAPFREFFVLQEIEKIAKESRLPFCYDTFGNLLVGVSKKSELAQGPKLLLFAHTDHPGFHIEKQKGHKLFGRWLGGAPFAYMKGAKVNLYSPKNSEDVKKGRIISIETKSYQRKGMSLVIESRTTERLAKGTFGAFSFPGAKIHRDLVTTRAADDLAGCVIALGAVLDNRKLKGKTVAIFTRAEEVGYIGCLAFLKHTKISAQSIAVSLEASKALPGARLGKGPVLRLGDRSTLFDNSASRYLLWAADEIRKKNKKLTYQRRIMDGGSCEATALNLYGVRTTGLSVPLKNYHNQGPKRPSPEVIHLQDVESARKICSEAGKKLRSFNKVSDRLAKSLEQNFLKLNNLLDKGRSVFQL